MKVSIHHPQLVKWILKQNSKTFMYNPCPILPWTCRIHLVMYRWNVEIIGLEAHDLGCSVYHLNEGGDLLDGRVLQGVQVTHAHLWKSDRPVFHRKLGCGLFAAKNVFVKHQCPRRQQSFENGHIYHKVDRGVIWNCFISWVCVPHICLS